MHHNACMKRHRPCIAESGSTFAALLTSLAALLPTGPAQANDISRAVPGGVVTLDLGASPARPQASLPNGVPVLVLGEPAGWKAVLGIPLSASPGSGQLLVRRAAQVEPERLGFAIGPHAVRRTAPDRGAGQGGPVQGRPGALRTRTRAPGQGHRHLQRHPTAGPDPARAGGRPAFEFVRVAPGLQRPGTQSAQRHGHRSADGHAGVRAAPGQGDRQPATTSSTARLFGWTTAPAC